MRSFQKFLLVVHVYVPLGKNLYKTANNQKWMLVLRCRNIITVNTFTQSPFKGSSGKNRELTRTTSTLSNSTPQRWELCRKGRVARNDDVLGLWKKIPSFLGTRQGVATLHALSFGLWGWLFWQLLPHAHSKLTIDPNQRMPVSLLASVVQVSHFEIQRVQGAHDIQSQHAELDPFRPLAMAYPPASENVWQKKLLKHINACCTYKPWMFMNFLWFSFSQSDWPLASKSHALPNSNHQSAGHSPQRFLYGPTMLRHRRGTKTSPALSTAFVVSVLGRYWKCMEVHGSAIPNMTGTIEGSIKYELFHVTSLVNVSQVLCLSITGKPSSSCSVQCSDAVRIPTLRDSTDTRGE